MLMLPKTFRRVGSYKDAIEWIAYNDDTEWIDDPNGSPSVTLCLVADVFGRTTEEATHDLKKALHRRDTIDAAFDAIFKTRAA